jgi:AcrR family transcriptional regulator
MVKGAESVEAVAGVPKPAGRKGFEPEVREAVVEAARKAMDSKGLEGVKARPIAQRAGISVGSIYNLFGDLDAVVRAVNGKTYDELYAIEMKALEDARAAGKDPREQMLALAEAYLDFVESHQTRWQATLAFNRGQTESPPRWYVEKELALFRIIEDALAAFPGVADANRRRLHARALWASIHGIVTIAVADGFLMQPIEDVWDEIRIVVNAVARSIENPA